jgi:hypothetical protein
MSSSPEIDLRSLPLHELLSAPLTAAIQAQQQASLGLVGFIRDVGFTGEDDQTREVRVVDFRYIREGRDAEGNPVKFDTRLRVPLLAMISLPNLEIDSLNVNVLVGLQSVSTTEVSPRLGIPADLQNRYPFLRGFSSLRVAPTARTTVKGETQTTRPYDLEITTAVSSEESLDGVQRILTALTGLIAEETK